MSSDLVYALTPPVLECAGWLNIHSLIYCKIFSAMDEIKKVQAIKSNTQTSVHACHIISFPNTKGWEKMAHAVPFAGLRVSSLASFQFALQNPKITFLFLDFSQKMELDVPMARLLTEKGKVFVIPFSSFLNAKPSQLNSMISRATLFLRILVKLKSQVIIASTALDEYGLRSNANLSEFAQFLNQNPRYFIQQSNHLFQKLFSRNSLAGFHVISKK